MHSIKSKGFTLIELLVVIAIISILAAILFPVFAQAKLAAKKTVDLSNLKQIGLALAIYQNDYEDTLPLSTGFDQKDYANGTWQYGQMDRWCSASVLGPYAKSTGIFFTPVDQPYKPDYTTSGYSYAAPIPNSRVGADLSYMTNALSHDTLYNCSYYFPADISTCNGAFDPGAYYDDPSPDGGTMYHTTPLTDASQPSSLIMLTNGEQDFTTWYFGQDLSNLFTTETIPAIGSDVLYGWETLSLAQGTFYGSPDPHIYNAWRKYSGSSNFVFADTHAKNMQPGALVLSATLLNPKYWLMDVPEQYQ
jgi:prepilin-type N-terminal cleavage/methylation domain-containing protein